jgi:hypothetical protein
MNNQPKLYYFKSQNYNFVNIYLFILIKFTFMIFGFDNIKDKRKPH